MSPYLINLLAAAALTAAAIGPAGGQSATPQISRQQALDLARKQGMATMYEIELDGDRWEIDGNQPDGRRIEIDLNAATGEIIKLDKH